MLFDRVTASERVVDKVHNVKISLRGTGHSLQTKNECASSIKVW